jgi:hypothetical protein
MERQSAPGDECRIVGGQERNSTGYIFRRAEPTERLVQQTLSHSTKASIDPAQHSVRGWQALTGERSLAHDDSWQFGIWSVPCRIQVVFPSATTAGH